MRNVYKMKVVVSFLVLVLVTGCTGDRKEAWRKLVHEADRLYDVSSYYQAVGKYQEALAIRPNDGHVLKRMGLSYLRTGEHGVAEHFLSRYVQLNPEDLKIKAEIIRINLLDRNLANARQILASLNESQKKDPGITMLRGDLEMIKNNYQEASNIYLSVLEKDKENVSASISLAMSTFAQGDKDVAEKAISGLKADGIIEPAILLQLGDYYRLSDNDQKAEQRYIDAVKCSNGELGYKLHLANYYIDKLDYSNAILSLNEILVKDRSAIAARKLIAQAYLSTSDMKNAKYHLDALEDHNTSDFELLLLKGSYHLQSAEPALAETYYESAVQKDPESAVAHYWSAIALLNSGQIQLAKQHLINALSLSQGFVEAELALGGIYYRTKEYDISEEYLIRIIRKDPNNIRAYRLLGGVYLGQKRFEEAVDIFKTAEQLDPQDSKTQYYLGRSYEETGKYEKAQIIYRKILDNKFVINAALRYANLLVDSGNTALAIKYFSEKVDKEPGNGILFFILAEIHFADGNTAKAIENYKNLILKEPKFETGYVRLADLYLQLDNIEDAMHVMSLCEEKNKDSLIAYLKNASIFYSQDLNDESLKLLNNAEKIFNDSDIIKNNIAYIYLEKGINLNIALELAQSAYQRNHNIPTFIDTLGWAYHKKGMNRQALWYLERGLQKLEKEGCKEKNHCAIMLYHLGSVFYALQNYDEAELNLETSLSLGLGGTQAEQANILLNAIRNEKEISTIKDSEISIKGKTS